MGMLCFGRRVACMNAGTWNNGKGNDRWSQSGLVHVSDKYPNHTYQLSLSGMRYHSTKNLESFFLGVLVLIFFFPLPFSLFPLVCLGLCFSFPCSSCLLTFSKKKRLGVSLEKKNGCRMVSSELVWWWCRWMFSDRGYLYRVHDFSEFLCFGTGIIIGIAIRITSHRILQVT